MIAAKTPVASENKQAVETKRFDENKADSANLIDFGEIKSKVQPNESPTSGFHLLGELLSYLRENRLMQLLLICRQIQKIEIIGTVAEISADEDLSELNENENFKAELVKFFASKNLGYKIKEKVKTVSAEDELRALLGNKLKIV